MFWHARVEKELKSMSWSLAVIFNQLGLFNIKQYGICILDEVVVLIVS
jgi:hypothetical protein